MDHSLDDEQQLAAMLTSLTFDAHVAESDDDDVAFQLQIQEAIDASLCDNQNDDDDDDDDDDDNQNQNQNDDDVLLAASAAKFAEYIARSEQELLDRELAEAHTNSMQDDLNRLVHDQVFARQISSIPDEEWVKTGNHFSKPYGEGSSSMAETYRLHCKGLVTEEMVGGVKRLVAGIGIAICDSSDGLVFEMRKPLVSSELSADFAELTAVIEGLDAVLMLGIKRVNVLYDSHVLHGYLTGVSIPKNGNMTTLVGQLTLLQKKFSYFAPSLVLQKEIKFVTELANEALISQLAWPTDYGSRKVKKTCLICLEDVDVIKMYSIDGCKHSYCPSCIKQHAEVKLSQGKLPKCPHEGCTIELKLETCKQFFNPELFDMLNQRVMEAFIPAKNKIYCPNPKCSALMTKSQALMSTNTDGASRCLKCSVRFCMECKVPWHTNMNCDDYKKSHPFPCVEDAKLNFLATKKLWRQCVMCKSLVELAYGCYHIYCRCGYEFCYTCGAEWKEKKATCKCPIWDERNIIRR